MAGKPDVTVHTEFTGDATSAVNAAKQNAEAVVKTEVEQTSALKGTGQAIAAKTDGLRALTGAIAGSVGAFTAMAGVAGLVTGALAAATNALENFFERQQGSDGASVALRNALTQNANTLDEYAKKVEFAARADLDSPEAARDSRIIAARKEFNDLNAKLADVKGNLSQYQADLLREQQAEAYKVLQANEETIAARYEIEKAAELEQQRLIAEGQQKAALADERNAADQEQALRDIAEQQQIDALKARDAVEKAYIESAQRIGAAMTDALVAPFEKLKQAQEQFFASQQQQITAADGFAASLAATSYSSLPDGWGY